MGELLQVPVWGQWSIMGSIFAILVFVITQMVRGELISKSHLDRERELAELWKDAWEKERQASTQYAESVTRNIELIETLKAVLNALPVKQEEAHDE